MKHNWHPDELNEDWTLTTDEKILSETKRGSSRLGYAVLLKFFQYQSRFPKSSREVPSRIIKHIAEQLNIGHSVWQQYDWEGRSIKYHRAEIRKLLGFREATAADSKDLAHWLCKHCLADTRRIERIEDAAYERLRALHIEPPSTDRLHRLILSALHQFDQGICESVYNRLPSDTCRRLNLLIEITDGQGADPYSEYPTLKVFRRDTGAITLKSLFFELERVNQLRSIQVPQSAFKGVSKQLLDAYHQRASIEQPHELRRHPKPLRMTLLAAFCICRLSTLTDNLIELLINLIRRINARAERKVEKELLADIKRVSGKTGMLYQLAAASLENPGGLVRDVIFSVVKETTLKAIVKEWKATGPFFRDRVQTRIRSSYRSHYRRMLTPLLSTLKFRSNNNNHRPVTEALEVLLRYSGSRIQHYPADESIPIDGVVPKAWLDAVVENIGQGERKINRLNYEICVLQALEKKIRCREIWIEGANRFGNPDKDLPCDFEVRRIKYYQILGLPMDPETFILKLKSELTEELAALDRSIPWNTQVKILEKQGGFIKLVPPEAQPEPINLAALKTDIPRLWPMTSLLNILKETDLRVRFTQSFQSPTPREHLDREELQYRILLCLYGIGTNTGLKRVAAGQSRASYRDLLYTRQRYISKDHIRQAIADVVNHTLQARLPQIWGEGTTACASDARYFSAWDQNLLSEWRMRYGGPVVGIYWHVERHATCIYSQLKSCSSSEVAAMIQGVLRHCTDMEVDRQYVDSHGQSTVGFAFCRLLGFELLPRLKAIHSKRLYPPDSDCSHKYFNLKPVLSTAIRWEIIGHQYDEMVKFATAFRQGTTDSESILRRFTHNNRQHPTYKALSQLGKACRTIFLCRYLRLPELRREINEGLNVVENWNSANDFILFGKSSEIASNRQGDQELTMLALHLLQNSLVFINTLMLQQVLIRDNWKDRLTKEDWRGLTPLFYLHINPYGEFSLDMTKRLAIDEAVSQ